MTPAHRHRHRYRRRQSLVPLLRRLLFRLLCRLVAPHQTHQPGQEHRHQGKQRQQTKSGAYPDKRNRQGLVRVEADGTPPPLGFAAYGILHPNTLQFHTRHQKPALSTPTPLPYWERGRVRVLPSPLTATNFPHPTFTNRPQLRYTLPSQHYPKEKKNGRQD